MSDLGHASSVAVIAAMVQEMRPTVRELGLTPVTLGDHQAREGTAAGRRVVAAVTSMGTRAATEVTEAILEHRDVDHVIVMGICGAIDPDLAIGALVIPTETMVEETKRICHPVALGAHRPAGRLLTGDELHTDPSVVAAFHDEGFIAVDMETGAIGAVCEDRGLPWSVFRAVSDRAGDPALDGELLTMSTADGTPAPRAVARYVLRHPARLPKLAALGRGMKKAVAASTNATLAELRS